MSTFEATYPLMNGTTEQVATLSLTTLNATAAAVGTVSLPHRAGSQNLRTLFHIKNLSSETVTITGATDNTNFSSALTVIDTATGANVTSTNLGNGTYEVPSWFSFSQYKFTKSATTDRVFVAFAAITFPNA